MKHLLVKTHTGKNTTKFPKFYVKVQIMKRTIWQKIFIKKKNKKVNKNI